MISKIVTMQCYITKKQHRSHKQHQNKHTNKLTININSKANTFLDYIILDKLTNNNTNISNITQINKT